MRRKIISNNSLIKTTDAHDQNIKIKTQDEKNVLNFCANNYLGLANHPEIIKGFAKIANMMSEDKIVSTESENVNTVADIETEISTITNDTDGPYWNKQHPDHDKMVQQVYTLREMLNADQ